MARRQPPTVGQEVAAAATWNARVALVRQVPERFGIAQQANVYADIAERAYVPSLTPEFGYVHWRPEYELESVEAAYRRAAGATGDFARVTREDIAHVIEDTPITLRVFRLLVGLTGAEFAEATVAVSPDSPVSKGRVGAIEGGRAASAVEADACAGVVDEIMSGRMFPGGQPGSLRPKIEKPDTRDGWDTVRVFAANGVPLDTFLHQRAYGGAFRQLLDATSSLRGDVLEAPVEALFQEAGVPYLRTGAHNQLAIAEHFGITVRPAPDFVVFDQTDAVRAMLECKGASDGGTARDKAGRFQTLRAEGQRLGGVPVFAVLGGIGWRRTRDALGPVVKHTDGRVFTLATLPEMLDAEPFPALKGLKPPT